MKTIFIGDFTAVVSYMERHNMESQRAIHAQRLEHIEGTTPEKFCVVLVQGHQHFPELKLACYEKGLTVTRA